MAPEAQEPDGPRAAELGQQEGGDQEAREHEEDVDAEEPAAEPAHPTVEQDHEHDAEGSDAVQARDGGDRRLWVGGLGLRSLVDRRCRRHAATGPRALGTDPAPSLAAFFARHRIRGFSIRYHEAMAIPKMIARRASSVGQKPQPVWFGWRAR